MMAPHWRKVFRDLWSNKTRTILVSLSIAVGVTAIGMVLGAQGIVDRSLPAAYVAVQTLTAIMAQQVRQIGIMKAIGGRVTQIFQMYFVMLLIFGALAALVAVPLAALVAVPLAALVALGLASLLTTKSRPL